MTVAGLDAGLCSGLPFCGSSTIALCFLHAETVGNARGYRLAWTPSIRASRHFVLGSAIRLAVCAGNQSNTDRTARGRVDRGIDAYDLPPCRMRTAELPLLIAASI